MACGRGGVDKLNLKTKTFTHYRYNPSDNKTLAGDNIFYITEDRQKNIWIGLWKGGVNLYNRKQNNFTRLPFGAGDSKTLNGYIPLYVYDDKLNNLWIGMETSGLNLLNKSNNTFKYYLNNKNDPYSLSNNSVSCIYEDTHKRLWIGTKGGLNLLDRKKEVFRRFTVNDGLPNEIICGILEDTNGNLWISTNNGISKVSITESQNHLFAAFKNFDKLDGLLNNQFNVWSSLRTKRGELIFGGINGVNIFFPDSIRDNPMIPPIVITGFSIFNKLVPIGRNGSPLIKHISETKTLVLSYKESVFSFDYAALNYINTNKNRYAYKMEGFETEWNYVGGQRKATYTNLDPGKYVFRVIGSNNDGYWNREGTSLQIIITPPWWKTNLFKILVFLTFVFSLFFAYYLKLKLYKNKQKELLTLVRQRTQEIAKANDNLLERQTRIEEQAEEIRAHAENLKEANDLLIDKQYLIETQANQLKESNHQLNNTNQQLSVLNSTKDRFFSIIAHDLRNPFHVVIGFSEILLNEYDKTSKEKILKFLKLIHSSSKSGNDLLENLLQWSRSQTGRIAFDPSAITLAAIVEEVFNLMEGEALKKNIRLLQLIPSNIRVTADENMVKTIFRNLISNAIKFTPDNGTVMVKAKLMSSFVEITVADNGVGIAPENQDLLFRIDTLFTTKGTANEPSTGLGLIICKEFVERNNGKIWLESKVDQGSEFKFTLPMA